MLKKILLSLIVSLFVPTVLAANFVILPNIKTQYLLATNADQALLNETKAIEVVKSNLNLTAYRTVRIRLLYNSDNQVTALIVYLLSAEYKSVELVRINLSDWKIISIQRNYQMQDSDFQQSPNYHSERKPHCPDESVQFVIGNNFTGDTSVETEVQRVYQAAKAKGYNPFMMDTNDEKGPQPTVQAYEDWLSCKNVKGFYNESHGYQQGIVLTDDDFTYRNVNQDLIDKFNHEVILFDSCLTFHNPLLDSMMNSQKGNSQQYIAGIISLPFGSSERTARCFWLNALDQQALTPDMLKECARVNGLDLKGYGIDGNGSQYLSKAD